MRQPIFCPEVLMNEFTYLPVASVLHDAAAVDKIHEHYLSFLQSAGGTRTTSEASGGTHFYFILTGGTEGIVLRDLASRGGTTRENPVMLIAHPAHNSLPAAMEILARIRQDGGFGALILLRSPGQLSEDMGTIDRLKALSEVHAAIRAMHSSKIGAVGEPSDWLVASSQDDISVNHSWGPDIDHLSIEELKSRLASCRADDLAGSISGASNPLQPSASVFLGNAGFRGEPVKADMYKSDTIFRTLKTLVAGRGWDAITLRCFDLVISDASTGCYALSALADDGIDAGCEGDIPSILALRWMRLLSGKPAWMANPADIEILENGRGRLLLAHCTVPRSLVSSYGVRSHFESGLGVAIAGKFPQGTMTLARIGGKNLDRLWIAEGRVLDTELKEGLCRTQLLLDMDADDLSKLIDEPLGNHLVVGMGSHSERARLYMSLQGMSEI